LRYVLSRYEPPFSRVLLIESGSRALFEQYIPALLKNYGEEIQIDLVTCYAGNPECLPKQSRVYRTYDYAAASGRKRLYGELRQNMYDAIGIICSGEPIMTKWKWALAAKVPAKVFVINENGDRFWIDRLHWRTIRHFVLFRCGLSGAGAVGTLARIAFFPFTLSYLLLFAAAVHLKRQFRRMVQA
jgi:hypothetical protein